MKKYKVFVFILILFSMCGCTVRNEITMSMDGKISEKVSILDNIKNDSSDKEAFEKKFQSYMKNHEKSFAKFNYSIVKKYDNNSLSGVVFSNKYDNMCKYIDKNLFTYNIYNKISCNENDYYIEVKTTSTYPVYCSDCVDRTYLSDAEFIINLPIKADESNADKEKDNTYTWVFDKNTDENKSVYIKINKIKLKKYQEEFLENQKKDKMLKLIFGISSIIVIFIIAFVILYGRYKKNKLEY